MKKEQEVKIELRGMTLSPSVKATGRIVTEEAMTAHNTFDKPDTAVVNGPGEARSADLGITGVGDKVMLFRHGELLRTIDVRDADKAW